MEFNPSNHVIKLCVAGMGMEDKGDEDGARSLFLQAWDDATNDLESFIAAYLLARHQETVEARLEWLGRSFNHALKTGGAAAGPAFPALYTMIAACYEDLDQPGKAEKYRSLAASFDQGPSDTGPFYHGTRADLKVGDLLTPGGSSNYQDDLVMNHIYFTALPSGAGLAAALAKGDGHERVYIVEPTGPFEHDPNVTNKKFPGNPTRSYRSSDPLKVVGETQDWVRQTPEELGKWREKLANVKGEIIN